MLTYLFKADEATNSFTFGFSFLLVGWFDLVWFVVFFCVCVWLVGLGFVFPEEPLLPFADAEQDCVHVNLVAREEYNRVVTQQVLAGNYEN